MKKLTFNDPHRQKHFDFFRRMNHPHFSVCANVPITPLFRKVKSEGLKFMPTIVWAVSHVANQLAPFRQRIRENYAVEHQAVHPSFTVKTEASDVFSFCEVKYTPDFRVFMERAVEKIAHMQSMPSLEDEDRDDYLYLSTLPWVSFTSIQHAMHFHPHDSVPRIVWGKYFEKDGQIHMPVSVQAHHALVDGSHIGEFFNTFESICDKPSDWF